MPDAYGQSLKALLSQFAASKTMSGVSGAETRMHTPTPGESEDQNGLPDSILSMGPSLSCSIGLILHNLYGLLVGYPVLHK
uniref:Uncharacterized protein n=1 Tax=Tanacetum cinerariifolium TaxID=118510 RepID=A0A699TMT5_TANCI|nr:hypothetical protein [Tanacetum cinerariifolium]